MNPAALETLRDIHLPPPLFLVLGLPMFMVLLVAVFVLWWTMRRFVRRAPLRKALRALDQSYTDYLQSGDATQLAGVLSSLLRQFAMRSFPDSGVASLTGVTWLEFLDARGGNGDFVDGAGVVLAWRPYQSHGEVDAATLVALVHRWLKANAP